MDGDNVRMLHLGIRNEKADTALLQSGGAANNNAKMEKKLLIL
jgi:hypothetical protein